MGRGVWCFDVGPGGFDRESALRAHSDNLTAAKDDPVLFSRITGTCDAGRQEGQDDANPRSRSWLLAQKSATQVLHGPGLTPENETPKKERVRLHCLGCWLEPRRDAADAVAWPSARFPLFTILGARIASFAPASGLPYRLTLQPGQARPRGEGT
jgi:hypothetical protein